MLAELILIGDYLLDGWLHRLTDPLAADASAKSHARTGTVETWKSINSNPKLESRGASDRVLLTRDDVLLDRLPYLRRISRNTAERQDLEKLTQFQGIGSRWARLAEEEAEQPGDEVAEERDAAPPTELEDDAVLFADGGKQGAVMGTGTGRQNDGGGALELAAETEVKLVLSDDDIEDGDD
ncbi:Cell cycle checkpoint protein rad17 [Ascosphaera atra]|nr:Cell cycle checkpoint protein rad17 [Ascosphaera atra]